MSAARGAAFCICETRVAARRSAPAAARDELGLPHPELGGALPRARGLRRPSSPTPAAAAAHTPPRRALPPPSPSRSVYIGNYSYQADEKDLAALAEKYGKYKALEMKTGAPYSR